MIIKRFSSIEQAFSLYSSKQTAIRKKFKVIP